MFSIKNIDIRRYSYSSSFKKRSNSTATHSVELLLSLIISLVHVNEVSSEDDWRNHIIDILSPSIFLLFSLNLRNWCGMLWLGSWTQVKHFLARGLLCSPTFLWPFGWLTYRYRIFSDSRSALVFMFLIIIFYAFKRHF